jgi:paraquat-inducible protein B
MSKPLNPVAIGGFAVGALALLVAGVLLFGGAELYGTDKTRFVVFFDSSLNGLDVGAPVKMQGVKIGAVTEIVLQIDEKSGKVYKPVVLEIDRASFVGAGGRAFTKAVTHKQQEENRDRLVAAGFRARLEMQSLLTGLLYVDFDVHPDKPAQLVGLDYHSLVELPSIPTTTDEIRNTADELAKKLRTLPLDQMVQDFSETLRDVRKLLGSEEVKRSNEALAKTLEEMERITGTLNRNLEPLLKETNSAISNTNALVQDVRHDMKPLLVTAQDTLSAATTTLGKAQVAIETAGDALGEESALNETLVALKDAARSIRDLTDYLERHPEAVLSGKQP